MSNRDARQAHVVTWARDTFGDEAMALPQRGIRLAEEAIELAQAAGCDRDMLHKLVDYVYSRPVGALAQELGGTGVALLALAGVAGLSAEMEEAQEAQRVLAADRDHFRARNADKNAAGFDVSRKAR